MNMVFDYGSDLERLYSEKYGKEVYGISHLTEHLCFKSPHGYESDELLEMLKKNGNRNAGTNFTHINYYYNTIMENMDMAIDMVTAIAMNDFSRITQEEFESEKKVVISEVGMYNDDKQRMFHLTTNSALTGAHKDDNILGTPELLENCTLEDCISMRRISLQEAKKYICITYDPETFDIDGDEYTISEDDILEKLVLRLDSIPVNKTPLNIGRYEYYKPVKMLDKVKLDTGTERSMLTSIFTSTGNHRAVNMGNKYIEELAGDKSLFSVIRDKNSLTYSVGFYQSDIQNKHHTRLIVDVEKGNEEKFFDLMEKTIVEACDKFTEEEFDNLLYTTRLKAIMRRTDLVSYEFLFYAWIDVPYILKPVKNELSKDLSNVDTLLMKRYNTYADVKAYFNDLKEEVLNKRYKVIHSN
jgi:predicted Zn-dependent peptidase